MTQHMQAFFLHGPKDLRPASIPIPPLAADQVLVQVRATGLCGSDLHYYAHGRNGDFAPKAPFILGHEAAGEIIDSGAFADSLPIGSRVALDPSHPCRVCPQCLRGRYNLCANMQYFGSAATFPHVDGSFRQYLPVRAENCHLIPPAMSFAEAALLEPLSVALQGVGNSGGVAGQSVLVCGAGPIGQLIGLVARHYGAAHLAVTDLRPQALQLAAENWADCGVLADAPPQLAAAAPDGGFDIIIEASGSAPALRTSIEYCRPGGTIVQVGNQAGPVELPVNLIMQRELTLQGSFRFAHVFAQAVGLLAQQRLDVRPLITQTVAFADLVTGFEAALTPKNIKVVIDYPATNP
ncbi:MAG: alcohol dehydrogenase catalytic domain-containing protein [Candidatus Latescibacteria bacterium]|nr:alcohol dehydrogenase catalytic domain-containing protein [Candidatus Latescibacterota bacterium]